MLAIGVAWGDLRGRAVVLESQNVELKAQVTRLADDSQIYRERSTAGAAQLERLRDQLAEARLTTEMVASLSARLGELAGRLNDMTRVNENQWQVIRENEAARKRMEQSPR